jgi:nucleotidyltransferase/DNA polymerase involved in DNA repair
MVGALLVPRFPVACELAEQPRLRGLPVAVARPDGSVWAASEAAEAAGVASGQTMREAITRCPTLVVIDGRPALYEAQAEAIFESMELATPGVEPGRAGIAYVDLRGLRRIYGSAKAIARVLLSCAPASLEPRLGLAPNKFVALAAAYGAGPGEWRLVNMDVAPFLAAQPLDVLPISDENRRRLRLLGIKTLAEVAAIPPSALAAQFGRAGELAWKLAQGEDEKPVHPRPRLERLVEHIDFEVPLVNRETLLMAVEQALVRALRQPRMQGRAARQLTVRASTERGACWERSLTFKEALAERDRIWTLLRVTIDDAQLPGPVSRLSLELAGLVPLLGWQLSLPLMRRRMREHLEEAMRQLKANYGYCPVGRIVEVEPWSRVPERRLALIDFDP